MIFVLKVYVFLVQSQQFFYFYFFNVASKLHLHETPHSFILKKNSYSDTTRCHAS